MTEQEQKPQIPVCPMMGVQTVPVKGNVASIASRQDVHLQDRFHPCLGPQCAWFMRVSDEQGGCSIPVIAANLVGWQEVETQDPEGE